MKNTDRPRRACGHCGHTEYEHDESLAGLLNRCGRFYAHRISGNRRGQSSVMTWLAHHPDVTQKELSEGLGIMPASLSEVLMKLERKGYVTRVKDENDRRFVRVRLTEEGEKALNEPADETSDPFVSLSEDEQETLKGLLGKLLADWETRYAADRACQSRRQFELRDGERPEHCGGHPEHGGERPEHGGGRPEHGGGRPEHGGGRPEHGDGHGEHKREFCADRMERGNGRDGGRCHHGRC